MKRMLRRCVLITVALIWIVSAKLLMGQGQNASLTGLVTDPSGAVIAGAAVTMKNGDTNGVYTQQTNSSGHYLFPSLPIGVYSVTVEMPQFKKSVQEGVVLQVGQHLRVNGRAFTNYVTRDRQTLGITRSKAFLAPAAWDEM